MCGIAGILSAVNQQLPSDVLQNMLQAISHRGPDGEKMWHNNKQTVLLGHRRLAIIDVTPAAAQPMHYLNRYSIVHNGEIYNYIELREILKQQGYQFISKSDTEVILAAFDFWKEKCLQQFDGMFAFAIWDNKEQQLFAARDRFGEKPFYYFENDYGLLFASEMKALWAGGVEKHVDEKMLLNYIAIGHVQNAADKEQTFFQDIYALPPAHYFMYKPATKKLLIKKYWQLNKDIQIAISPDEAIEKFTTLFTESVKKRLRSDVALGTSLSGGIDSASVAATINTLQNKPSSLQTFSAVFPGYEKDEASFINLVTTKLNCKNYSTQPIVDELITGFEKLSWHQEEPFASSSIFAQYKVYELAKQNNVKVLLDGQGADEILAGYHKYIHWFLQDVVTHQPSGEVHVQKKALRDHGIPVKWGVKNLISALLPMHAAMWLEKNEYQKIFHQPDINPDFLRVQRGKEWEGIHKSPITKLNDILHYNTVEFGLEELLRYADRNSMANGCEVRLPFLDHILVEFIFSLPTSLKINKGWTKWLLRMAMKNKIPDEVIWRKDKVGFEPPQQQWMENKMFQEYVHEAKRKLVNQRILRQKVLNKTTTPKSAIADNNYDWRYLCAAQII